MINNGIGYNLDLLGIGFRNGRNLSINMRIPPNIAEIWKNIHKVALIEKYTGVDKRFENPFDFGYLLNTPIGLPGQLISIINIGLISNLITPYFLNVISPDSNFKAICNQIYLLLLLNQLQQLIIGDILDYIIKNKKRMYLDSNQQLLIYVRDEGRVGKSRIVKVIKIGFTLLGKRKELVISALTRFIANGISRSTIHTALRVNNQMEKNY